MASYYELLKDAAKYCDIDGVVCDEALDAIHDEAYIQGCENDSPNSIGFDAMTERIEERLQVELFQKAHPNA